MFRSVTSYSSFCASSTSPHGFTIGRILMAATLAGTASWAARGDQPASFTGLGLADSQSTVGAMSEDGSTIVGISDGRIYRWSAANDTLQDLGAAAEIGIWSPSTSSFSNVIVSDDGSVVTGRLASGVAFRWTREQGTVALATGQSQSNALNSDGSAVVGAILDFSGNSRAFWWTATTGLVQLGSLPGHNQSNTAAISADGLRVAGSSWNWTSSTLRAFLWTSDEGMIDLGALPGTAISWAVAMSADGSTVVGGCGSWPRRAFRWRQNEGMIDLGVLPGCLSTEVTGVSADGSVVVGFCRGDDFDVIRAFRWTNAEGMVDLGTLPGQDSAMATAVSSDGLVVAGWSGSCALNSGWLCHGGAFRWTQEHGMIDLGVLSLPGHAASGGTALSADGSIVAGVSGHCSYSWMGPACTGRAIRWAVEKQAQIIPSFPSPTFASGVSADGEVVVGHTGGHRAFRHIATTGLEEIGWGHATAVSADGTVIVGGTVPETQWQGPFSQAFRWTADDGAVILPGDTFQNGELLAYRAHGVAADGSIIVGAVNQVEECVLHWAVQWTDPQTILEWPLGRAKAISADGTVMVGGYVGGCIEPWSVAYRWTEANGAESLGALPGHWYSDATAVNADGSVIVGVSGHQWFSGAAAFRWTPPSGMVELPSLLPAVPSQAHAVNADGSVIVGQSGWWNKSVAVCWHSALPEGVVDLNAYLPALGLDLAGWTLTDSTGISADGRTIVGNGINPDGIEEAWIATVPPIVPAIHGDLNGDGVVDVADLLMLLAAWGPCADPQNCAADLNGDGAVGVADLLALLANWG